MFGVETQGIQVTATRQLKLLVAVCFQPRQLWESVEFSRKLVKT